MKSLGLPFVTFFIFHAATVAASASRPTAGFFLPDSVTQMEITYKTVRNLIILPVIINDSVEVNLLLDTGCRNLILFGKRFSKLFTITKGKPVIFSGLGRGRAVSGGLSIGNKVSIKEVLGEQIPIVIVPNNNVFERYRNVDGVIGYDIFVKFEVEINPSEKTIIFRPAFGSSSPYGYTQVPLRIVDARPVLHSEVHLDEKNVWRLDLMIDTGSSLALLLKTTSIEDFHTEVGAAVLGFGFNGPLSGYQTISEKLRLRGLEMSNVSTGIVASSWHNNASIGMEILKQYVVVLNYCKAYAWFKPVGS